MDGKKSFARKLKLAGERFHDNGLRYTLAYYLKRFGFHITLIYYMKETLPEEVSVNPAENGIAHPSKVSGQVPVSSQLTTLSEEFAFSSFGPDEVKAISSLPERKDYVNENYVINNFNKGDICLGIKYKGMVVAFTWINLNKCNSKFYTAEMKSNEAYLYDMYVLKAYRGMNLAPFLRYQSYVVLRDLGRDTFYSITERSNTAALKFKRKLGAEIVNLALYVELFRKFKRTWVLRNYK